MKTEKSCGGIVFRKIGWNIEFLIIQQKQGSHWFFPKGHIEDNESEEQTALREIYEETWFHVDILPGFREIFSYYIDDTKSIEKNVVFFICEIVSWQLIMSDELQNCMWLDYEQAMKTLTHDNSKAVLTKAYNFLSL
ncbi:MAG: NUDIX hydrolase [uncultured bacterium (gcode 4)]|uniref:Bis(5'-nucleosyl)-tetraphosphatase [asymmetrical] n=1 Tax=uncultured bacterium (gcode 4) TaxID=1234023 RepID=K1X408_9BACT|nr:MAG: NUDIX hydrolase [uncultured bacterium (gcode 4)]